MNEFEKALYRYLTPEQACKIQQSKIGIAGAGGLGSNCAQMLVRCGFKWIKIIDFDILDYSNLNRQFYFLPQVGQHKVFALRDTLRQINPDIELECLTVKLEAENMANAFSDCHVVIEAFDRPEYKRKLVEAYMTRSDKLLVSVSGLAGWGNSDRIQVHRIKKNFYMVGDLTSAVGPDCPPMAPCVMIAAAKQADLVLHYVLGPMKGGGQWQEKQR